MTARIPRLHAVTDARILAMDDLQSRAAALAGDPAVALHCRHASTALAAVERTELFLAVAQGAGARVLVNDRADIARATGAHGLHLPARGLPVDAARGLVGRGALIGRSTHTPEEARRAGDEGADYVFFGPVWSTPSHPDRPPTGPAGLEQAAAAGVPVIAIGGVTAARVPTCLAAGAWGVAALSALWDVPDPGSAAARFLLSFG